MSLINYVEPSNAGDLFVGIGGMVLTLVTACIMYRLYLKFIQYIDLIINREAKYEILQESFLDKIGKAKGIDLNQELIKRKMFQEKPKNFRKRLEDKMYKDMFPEAEKTKK
jgi:hypothetical protein